MLRAEHHLLLNFVVSLQLDKMILNVILHFPQTPT